MKTKMKVKAGQIVAIVVIAAAVALGVLMATSKRVMKDKVPLTFGYAVSEILSGSMEPTISAGDVVLLKACDSYEVGDIVVHLDGTMLVLHRIVAMDGSRVTTKGDANNVADETFDASMIQAKMIGIWKGGGRVLQVTRSPLFIACLMGAAVLLLILTGRRKEEPEAEQIEAEN